MADLWIPGLAGPLDDLVARIHRRIETFAREHGLEQAAVEVELADGSVHRLQAISAEPGYGYVSLRPHPEDGEPLELIVAVGAIRSITLGRPEPQQRFGFSLPAE